MEMKMSPKLLIILMYSILDTAYGQIHKEWSVIHYPYGSQNNYQRLVHDQIIINSSNEIICGWNCTIIDSSFNTIGVTSHNSQGQLNWFDDYKGIYTQNELLNISIDSNNNIYSMGKVNMNTFSEDNIIIKYDVNGSRLWVEPEDTVEDFGFDGRILNDSYYLMTNYKPGLIKYDLNGNLIDSIPNDTISPNLYSWNGIIFSKNNSLFYGGLAAVNSASPYDIFASKTINGDSVIWKKIINVTSGSDICHSITSDSEGNLFLLASADIQSGNSYTFICAFDKDNGDTLWTNTVPAGPNNMETFPTDIQVDDAGNVYVVSEIYNLSLNRYQTRLTQFNASSGAKNWQMDFDSLYFAGLNYSKCFIDSTTKNVFVAYSVLPNANFPRTCIANIDSTGNLLWKAWFDSLGTVRGFTGDHTGNLFVAGSLLTKFSLITDVEEQTDAGSNILSAYFSPETNYINITASSMKGKKYNLSIIDAIGHSVYTEQGRAADLFHKSIPFSIKKDGLYLVVLETEKERLTGTVVVYYR